MLWWKRKPKQEEVLRPGLCECTHNRSSHENGKGKCHATEDDWPDGSSCACQIYIRAEDDNDGDVQPETPSLSELEKMYQL